jgi:arylformamidase
MKIIDISTDLLTSKVYPGDPQPKLQLLNRIDLGDEYELSAIYSGLHAGTHIDAPMHFIEDGDSIDQIPLDVFVGPCRVVEINSEYITGKTVESFPKNCKRLLIKTHSGAKFMAGAAEDAAKMGFDLIGIDALTVGTNDDNAAVHRAFLAGKIALLEGLDLTKTTPGEYFLIAPPVKIVGREAAFARALLIADYIFWGGKV